MIYKIMEEVIKEFQYTHKLGQTETIYNFKAVIKPSYFANYRIKTTTTTKFENGNITIITESELYFKDRDKMIQNFTYYYKLAKNDILTKSIKIIK